MDTDEKAINDTGKQFTQKCALATGCKDHVSSNLSV